MSSLSQEVFQLIQVWVSEVILGIRRVMREAVEIFFAIISDEAEIGGDVGQFAFHGTTEGFHDVGLSVCKR